MKYLKFVLAALFVTAVALAQTTGAIEGTVFDNNKQPLPGVTIELTSPALQGVRVVQTDVNGKFSAKLLQIGEYKLAAKMSGFAELEQTGIQVGLGRTVSLQVNMQPAFEEKITITGESPVVDVTSTTTGSSFSKELMEDLPTGRSYQSIAFLAAGAVQGGLGDNPSIMGSSAGENRYIVDGMDTTDPAFGTIGTNVTYNFVQEIEVKTGGYEAEYGGALGGVVNVVTKQGSNEFHGDVFGYFTDDSLTEEGKEVPSANASTLDSFKTYDYGFDLGGKFIEDKLWYFIAINPTFHEETRHIDIKKRASTEVVQTNNLNPEVSGNYVAAKLNWQITPSNTLIGTVIGDPIERDNEYYSAFHVSAPNTGYVADGQQVQTNMFYKDYEEGSWNYGATLNSILTPSLLLEVKLATFEYTEKYLSIYDYYSWEDGTGTGMWSNGVGQRNWQGGPGFQTPNGDRSRDQLKAALSWFVGNHEVKFGAQYFKMEYSDIAYTSGPSAEHCVPLAEGAYTFDPLTGGYPELVPNCDSNGDGVDDGYLIPAYPGNRYRLRGGYHYNSNYKNFSMGQTTEYTLFVQDSWKVTPTFTLNLGLRADSSKIEGELTSVYAGREIELGFGDQLAPRIGFIWDFMGDGRSKAYGHYGQFYESIPLDINVRAFGDERYDFLFYYYPEDGNLPTPTNSGEMFYYLPAGQGTMADPNLKGQYMEEFVVGAEYEVLPNIAVGIKGIYRDLAEVIEDISVTHGNTYFITNPGGCYDVDPVTGAPIDIGNDGVYDTVCFPEATRTYKGVELTFNKRFSNNWQMYTSLLWSQNKGNYGGLFRQDNGQNDPNITSAFDLPQLLIMADGYLPNDREWQFKTYGSYRFPFGLTTGFDFSYVTGTPISKLGGHMLYGPRERFVTTRGTEGRTPDLWWANMHMSYPIKLGGMELGLIADIFNITNEQKAIYVNQEWTFLSKYYENPDNPLDWIDPNEADLSYFYKENCDDWLTSGLDDAAIRRTYCRNWNPNWGKATAYQDPRSFRIGFKLSW